MNCDLWDCYEAKFHMCLCLNVRFHLDALEMKAVLLR